MDEKEEQTQDSKPTTDDTEEGDKSSAVGLVDKASNAAERLEKAIAKDEDNLRRREALMAKEQLAGKASAGQNPPKVEKQKDEEYANEFLEGKNQENVLIPDKK